MALSRICARRVLLEARTKTRVRVWLAPRNESTNANSNLSGRGASELRNLVNTRVLDIELAFAMYFMKQSVFHHMFIAWTVFERRLHSRLVQFCAKLVHTYV